MMLNLERKRALVLASSSGLGFAIADRLAREGASVVLSSRDRHRSNAAAEKIRSGLTSSNEGQKIVGTVADVSKAASLTALIEYAKKDLGGIDILVCNAGGPPPGAFQTHDDSAWTNAFELTLMSVVRSIRGTYPLLRSSESPAIAVIGSSSVKRPIPNLIMSNVFRPAVHALITDLSAELAADGIRINMISPGRIHTDRVDQLDRAKAERVHKSFSQVRDEAIQAIPIGRLGTPEEFAKTVVYFLSDAASYVTGQSIIVDGGLVRVL